jgi:hypothetical protein
MERAKQDVLPGHEAVSAAWGSRQSVQDRASDGRLAQSTTTMTRRRAAPCRAEVGMIDGVGDGQCPAGRKTVLRGPVVREKGGLTSGSGPMNSTNSLLNRIFELSWYRNGHKMAFFAQKISNKI